jgi:predicted secreted protein
LQTGGFSLKPRYGRDGRMSGWTGRVELVVQGRDTAAIAQLAGRIQTLSVASTGLSLSREARETVESQVAAEAIARFRARADVKIR